MTEADDIYTPGNGLPIALPLGTSDAQTSLQVIREFQHLPETNTPPTSSALPAADRRRVSQKQLDALAGVVSDRDMDVLERLDAHRYLTTLQIQRFSFTAHTTLDSAQRTTRRALQRLQQLQLIRSLTRRIGGVRAGSSATIWQLTSAATRLLRREGSTSRRGDPSLRFLSHCLAVADFHLSLRDLRSDPRVTNVSVETEPDSWRRYSGPAGEPRLLQPDLAAVVSTASYDDRFFVEVDLGTESQKTLLRKCGQYEDYRATGIEQDSHGAFPLVIWFFTRPDRAERLAAAVQNSSRLTSPLFRYVTPRTVSQSLREGIE